MDSRSRNRIVIETSRGRHTRVGQRPARQRGPASREWVVVVSVIAAAALATFLALFLTSRPFNPMTPSLDAQQEVPPSALSLQPSPKPSPSPSARPSQSAATTATPTAPTGEIGAPATDDAAIQTEIEKRIAADAILSGLAVSTLVEGGKVSVFGSVRSPELKSRVERLIRSINGVIAVDNQLVVTQPTP